MAEQVIIAWVSEIRTRADQPNPPSSFGYAIARKLVNVAPNLAAREIAWPRVR
jgi:hypothetical protein